MADSFDKEIGSFFAGHPVFEGLESPEYGALVDDVTFSNLLEADNFLLSDLTQGKSGTKSPLQLSESRMSGDWNSPVNSDVAPEDADELNSNAFFQGVDRDLLHYFDGGSSSDEDVSTAAQMKGRRRNKENVNFNKNVNTKAFGCVVSNSKAKIVPVRNVTPMTRQKEKMVKICIKHEDEQTSNRANGNVQCVNVTIDDDSPSSNATVEASQVEKAPEEKSRRNAEQAKLHRKKKKIYVQGLETDVKRLRTENDKLQSENNTLNNRTTALEEEVEYLKNVLANESSLSKLLENIDSVKNVRLSSSFRLRKRSAALEHSYDSEPPLKRPATAGVCLHVDKDDVSLEFCSHCSSMAKLDKNK